MIRAFRGAILSKELKHPNSTNEPFCHFQIISKRESKKSNFQSKVWKDMKYVEICGAHEKTENSFPFWIEKSDQITLILWHAGADILATIRTMTQWQRPGKTNDVAIFPVWLLYKPEMYKW